MRIGIDARLYDLKHAGLGRYVIQLVKNVLKYDKKNEYVLFLPTSSASEFQNRKNVKVVVTDIPIYSFREQLVLPLIFMKEKLDLLHVPYFNAPFLYPGKFVLTIHDLIKHDSKGIDTTTRQPWLYFVRRLGYLFLMSIIAKRAFFVIVPSKYVKSDVAKRLHVPSDKISVTYEAVSKTLKDVVLSPAEKKVVLDKYGLRQPFLVYTGSIYPHKNVPLLVEAVAKHNATKEMDLQLAIICSRSVFWERLQKEIQEKGLQSSIKMLGFVNDEDVAKIYSLALALVHPSKMEGFGLTGLEAMGVGLPVISSNASCLPEIYGDAALYFDHNSVDELTDRLQLIIKDSELRNNLSVKGYIQARKYSWDKTGKETLEIYKRLLSP